jgi:hypothetical protein
MRNFILVGCMSSREAHYLINSNFNTCIPCSAKPTAPICLLVQMARSGQIQDTVVAGIVMIDLDEGY